MEKTSKITNGNNIEQFSKIVNGIDLPSNKFSKYNFLGSLRISNSNMPYGGASYIGNNIVITAAHCVFNLNPRRLIVQFNKKSLYDKGIEFKVRRIKIHPGYNQKTLNNDIAILYLEAKPSDYNINQVNLPNNNLLDFLYKKNRQCVILGYGKNNFTGYVPNNLKYALVNVMLLNQTMIPKNWVTNNMILAGDYNDINNPNDNEDSCQGDSGGPLFGNYGKNRSPVLMGITSWGVGCAWDGFPGVYTKIGNYLNWIKKNI